MRPKTYPAPKLTEAQLKAIKAEEEKWKEEERIRIEKQKIAEERARKLLVEHLDETQKKDLETKKLFNVVGQDGKRYEIDSTKRQHNVFELTEDGKRCREYCIVQTGGTPQSDHLLCQKLLLESDIEHFKKVANKWDLQRGRHAVVAG